MNVKVRKDYISAYPDPLIAKKGDVFKLQRKKAEWSGWKWCIREDGARGWIPEKYLEIDGGNATLLIDYDATEHTAKAGEILEVITEVAGWYYCLNDKQEKGWIPKENTHIFKKYSK
jgi:hypothetical protein